MKCVIEFYNGTVKAWHTFEDTKALFFSLDASQSSFNVPAVEVKLHSEDIQSRIEGICQKVKALQKKDLFRVSEKHSSKFSQSVP